MLCLRVLPPIIARSSFVCAHRQPPTAAYIIISIAFQLDSSLSLVQHFTLFSFTHFNNSSTMSGRGKGGKGLGKGGAKRHRKVLRDNIQ
jgi:hypothetical protein